MKRNSLLGMVLVVLVATAAFGQPPPSLPIYRGGQLKSECSLKEERDERFHDLLRVSVKVSVQGSAGSGTICHYDPASGLAYIISCGHLWSGDRPYDPSSPVPAKITVWYHDGPRLDRPATYDAEALFWSNSRGRDVSLLRFRPDWTPRCALIAPIASIEPGTRLNSMGCDGGKEVARYEVVVAEVNGTDIVTKVNSPRPGRSGGGLLTDECLIVGVCWGTSDTSSGDGIGFFTPLASCRKVFEKSGFAWLLDSHSDARSIPIVDRDEPAKSLGSHYLPIPMR